MRINYNALAMNATTNFGKINNKVAKSMSRLSSGYKITSPADDAAGLAISKKMSAQIRGLDRAALNSNDGISVIQSAEGGMEEMHSILGRMRELAVQAANDVNDEVDRDAIQEEIDSLAAELTQISDTTAFNGQTLLNGDLTRRSLSSVNGVKATYISSEVSTGVYSINVTADAEQASMTTGFTYSTAVITKEQAGTLKVNGFAIEIEEGMTMEDVYGKIQTSLAKINIDVFASNDGTTEESFDSGAPVVFRTKGYGSSEKISISVGNPELAAVFGVTDGTMMQGKDCQAALNITEDGFSTTATLKTNGNKIEVTDRSGFSMTIEADPGAVAENGGAVTAEIEVLSAGTMVIQTGSNEGEQLAIDIPELNAKSLGVDELIMYTHEYASQAVDIIDEAVKKVSAARSKLGAYENRLDDVHSNLEVQSESITEAYSRIMDTDMAEEMTEYTQQEVLSQAAISMMQKANDRPESPVTAAAVGGADRIGIICIRQEYEETTMTQEQKQEFTRRISQENHSGLILVLCDIFHTYGMDAMAAYEAENMTTYLQTIGQARRAMQELIECFSKEDPLGRNVIAILRFIYGKLVRSEVRRQPDELDRCVQMVDDLRVGFVHLHELDNEGAVMQNVHQVYAGLTYGKGTLNESIQGVNYEKRGYQV